jgi:hypothetical protein
MMIYFYIMMQVLLAMKISLRIKVTLQRDKEDFFNVSNARGVGVAGWGWGYIQ